MTTPIAIVVSLINEDQRICLNKILSMFDIGLEMKHLWQNIQHIDMFFSAKDTGKGLDADYSEKESSIDFYDEDGTLIFYVKQQS